METVRREGDQFDWADQKPHKKLKTSDGAYGCIEFDRKIETESVCISGAWTS